MNLLAVVAFAALAAAPVQLSTPIGDSSVAPPAVPLIPPASVDDTLEVTGDAVKARRVRTRLSVQVAINGQGPFRFIVDSGADRSIIGAGLAQRLRLPPGDPVTLLGVAGRATVGTVRVDSIKIGGSDIPDIVVPTLPEQWIDADGLVGIDALAEQRLMLDFDRKTITVQDSRRPAPFTSGEIVVTARRQKGQLIITQATVGKERIYAVIDTGAEVTIANSALAQRIFRKRKAPTSHPITLVSVTGQRIEALSAVVPDIRIGGIILSNVSVAFVDVPPFAAFGLADQPAMLIGSDVLEAFRRISLDFRHRKVRFVLR